MLATGSWPLLLVSLLSSLFHCDLSLAFSLKNCTILYTENANIVSVTCTEHDLTAIPDDIPRNAVSLNLTSNLISKIMRTDLEGLSKLEALHAENNFILQIDGGAFADLVELKVLMLGENILTNVTENMFQGLSKLETLSLYSNQISFISTVAFQHLVSILSVDLSDNELHQITDIEQIIKFPTLQYLDISYNNFSSLQSDDLHINTSNLLTLTLDSLKKFSITRDIYPHLQSLDLQRCSRDMEWDVSNKTFLRSLTRLYLSETHISFEVYRAMLQTADSLQDLQMYKMKEWMDDGLIDITCQIPSLRTLNISQNELYTINDNLLRSCSQLTELNLSFNQLNNMADNALQSMTQLRCLILQKNFLSELPLAVQGLTTLEVLDLSFNEISDLYCPDFRNLTSLTILHLSYNHISFLFDCVFENLNNLKALNLENNEILSFDYTFKDKLRRLEVLNLRNNDIINLSQGEFSNLSSLHYLDLDLHQCNSIDEGGFEGLDNLQTLFLLGDNYFYEHFRGLPNLKMLTLNVVSSRTHNSSQQRDDPFSDLPKLKKLVINVQKGYYATISKDVLSGLTSLEYLMTEAYFMGSLHTDTFKYTPRLKGLKITYSELSDLTSKVFWPIPNLKMLDLSNNKLRSLDFLAEAKLLALRWLNINNNELFIISETSIQSLLALTYLDLSANPLTCECFNYGLIQWIQSNKLTQVVNAHQYTCAYPVSQRGNKFLDFGFDSCRIDAGFLCFLFSSCLIVLTLLTSFIYHFLRWHLSYGYYLFLAFVYDNKMRKKDGRHSYDAFVSYNVHDEAWVYGELLPVLEGQQGWRLCLHHRDFEPGKPIVENITEAIYSSRKTICVISRHYLQSEWCSREIQMASFRLFNEHKDVLIMVFLEDIPAKQLSLYYQIRSLVKKRTYLSWPQAGQHAGVFWQKIRQALEGAENPTEHRHLLTEHPIVIQ